MKNINGNLKEKHYSKIHKITLLSKLASKAVKNIYKLK